MFGTPANCEYASALNGITTVITTSDFVLRAMLVIWFAAALPENVKLLSPHHFANT